MEARVKRFRSLITKKISKMTRFSRFQLVISSWRPSTLRKIPKTSSSPILMKMISTQNPRSTIRWSHHSTSKWSSILMNKGNSKSSSVETRISRLLTRLTKSFLIQRKTRKISRSRKDSNWLQMESKCLQHQRVRQEVLLLEEWVTQMSKKRRKKKLWNRLNNSLKKSETLALISIQTKTNK